MTMEQAVVKSVNTVPARILLEMGIDTSFNFLQQRLHISSLQEDDKYVGPLAMGGFTKGVSVLEMCAAYTAIANDGIYTSPITYTRVEANDGRVLLEKKSEGEIAMTEQTAFLVRESCRPPQNRRQHNAKMSGRPSPAANGHHIGGPLVYRHHAVLCRRRMVRLLEPSGCIPTATPPLAMGHRNEKDTHGQKAEKRFVQYAVRHRGAVLRRQRHGSGPYCTDPRGNRINGQLSAEPSLPSHARGIIRSGVHVLKPRRTRQLPTVKTVALLDYMRIYPRQAQRLRQLPAPGCITAP